MAFHPYPQLIPPVFNLGGYGPPRPFTIASTWPWVDHPASGLEHATKNAPFRLAFATDPPHGLTKPRTTNSQAHSSKGTPSPPKKGSDGLKANGFRYYFTPLPGYFSPFPHGTMHYRSPGSIQAYPVVWADSQQIPRARCYSGKTPRQNTVKRPTRLSRTTVTHPKMFNPNHVIYHYPHPHAENGRRIPQPHAR